MSNNLLEPQSNNTLHLPEKGDTIESNWLNHDPGFALPFIPPQFAYRQSENLSNQLKLGWVDDIQSWATHPLIDFKSDKLG